MSDLLNGKGRVSPTKIHFVLRHVEQFREKADELIFSDPESELNFKAAKVCLWCAAKLQDALVAELPGAVSKHLSLFDFDDDDTWT